MTLPSFVPQLKSKLETVREKGEVFIGNDELLSWQRKPTATSSKFGTAVFSVIRRHWNILNNATAASGEVAPALYVQDMGAEDTGVTLMTEKKRGSAEWFSLDDYSDQTLTLLKKRRKYPASR